MVNELKTDGISFEELEAAIEKDGEALKLLPCYAGFTPNDKCPGCPVGAECQNATLDGLTKLEAEMNEQPEEVVRIDAVAVPLPLEPITLAAPKPVDALSAAAGALEAAIVKNAYTARNKKRVAFDFDLATAAIRGAEPKTVGESAKICLAQIPAHRATAYNNSKKILAKLTAEGAVAIDGKKLNWLK